MNITLSNDVDLTGPWLPDGAPGSGIARACITTAADRAAVERVAVDTLLPAWTILECIEYAARLNPTKDAFRFLAAAENDAVTQHVTYGDLVLRIRATANALRLLVGGAAPTVAIIAGTTPDMLIAYWASVTAGRAIVINPAVDSMQIGRILDVAGVDLLLCDVDGHHGAAWHRLDEIFEFAGKAIPVIRLGAAGSAFEALVRTQVDGQLTFDYDNDPHRVVAMLPTGGTTGAPKLVQLTAYGQLLNAWCFGALSVSGRDEIVAMAMPNFHVGGLVALALRAMIFGQTLLILTPLGFRDPDIVRNFWTIAQREQITNIIAVPTTAAALLETDGPIVGHCIRSFNCGGSTVPVELFREFDRRTGIKLRETWGMSETHGPLTLQYSGDTTPIPGSVGVVYPFHRVIAAEIKDNRFIRLSEPGETGVLLLCGPLLTSGYFDASRNDELFIEGGPDGRCWASTGDLGTVDEAGFVWIFGRTKDLIIRGGHNIEPLCIESAAETHEDVLLVGAVGFPDRDKGELPVIYVQLKGGRDVAPQALLNHCRERIAERAAVPVEAFILTQMPTTAIGKIDKPALRRLAACNAAERVARTILGDGALHIEYDDRRGRPTAIISTDHPDIFDPAIVERFHKAFAGFAFAHRLSPLAGGDD